MKQMIKGMMVVGFTLASLQAWADMDSNRADLKEAVNEQLIETKKELVNLRNELSDKGTDAKTIEQAALTRLETSVASLENKISRIDAANETEWKSVKEDVARSQKELKQSLNYADDQID